jgi:hypothetical protein
MKKGRLIQKLRFDKSFKKASIFLTIGFIGVFFNYLFTMNAEVPQKNKISTQRGDTIEFSGYHWVVKDSYGKKAGPGNNYFSGSKDNVYVDSEGKLHMRITNRDDKWHCPEVRLLESPGLGRYYFYLDPMPQPFDKDVVIGMFLYDREDTNNFHKEIDIEISQWGKDTSLNTQYVIQPKEEEAYRFHTDLNIPTKHLIELGRKKIVFKSFYGSTSGDDMPLEYSNYKMKPDYEYYSNSERVSINVWLYQTSEPFNLKEFEVIISKFEFVPFWYDKLLNPKKYKKEDPK